ncbi:uncharacterized protein LOC133024170 [Limanda limanda]|uniref:uncharacterized protein LOC133024170 n=1 Tax=Limanda limanda TaxID=27771 RepID=UPI0029C7C3FB|nr:uncharacterized protein LOC133024170 [Limanda limanda]
MLTTHGEESDHREPDAVRHSHLQTCPDMPGHPQRHAGEALTSNDRFNIGMMAQAQPKASGSGRKRRMDIWTHFNYNEMEKKTQCTVITGEKLCGFKICGKNTTNLKRHLKAHHPSLHATIPDTRPEKQQPDSERMGTSIQAFFSSQLKYKADSAEQHIKEEAISQWIGRTGLPARSVEEEDFVPMMQSMDKRLTVPKKAKITNLVDKLYIAEREKFQDRISTARKITIGLDIWSKKGLTAAFLAISACYYCTQQKRANHILLRLEQISHPHTADCIKTCVDRCTEDWGISKEQILTVITDNRSNMVAAFKNEEDDEPSSDDEEVQNSDEESEECEEEQRYGAIKRIPCVVHTLQLVVNLIHKEQSIKRLFDKVRGLVRLFRKSSVATERLLQLCGLTLVKDCLTRWSSSYQMISRLLEVKDSTVQVADGMDWDCLLPSEWQKLAALRDLLLPFAEHTKMLQSDTMSLSLVVPALLDLSAHLSQFPQGTAYRDLAHLAKKMKANIEERFSCFLDPSDSKFSPLATAACFLDPTVSPETLIQNEDMQIQELLRRAEEYIAQTLSPQEEEEEERREAPETAPPSKRPRFQFLSKASTSRPLRPKPCVQQELQKFKEQLSQPIHEESAIDFWAAQGSTVYQTLKPFAYDLLAMPASQAFAERVFSITGDLTRGLRSRARLILERSTFLKLNRDQ